MGLSAMPTNGNSGNANGVNGFKGNGNVGGANTVKREPLGNLFVAGEDNGGPDPKRMRR